MTPPCNPFTCAAFDPSTTPHQWNSRQLLQSHTLQHGTSSQQALCASLVHLYLLIQVSWAGSSSLLCVFQDIFGRKQPLSALTSTVTVCALRDAPWMISSLHRHHGTYLYKPTHYVPWLYGTAYCSKSRMNKAAQDQIYNKNVCLVNALNVRCIYT